MNRSSCVSQRRNFGTWNTPTWIRVPGTRAVSHQEVGGDDLKRRPWKLETPSKGLSVVGCCCCCRLLSVVVAVVGCRAGGKVDKKLGQRPNRGVETFDFSSSEMWNDRPEAYVMELNLDAGSTCVCVCVCVHWLTHTHTHGPATVCGLPRESEREKERERERELERSSST